MPRPPFSAPHLRPVPHPVTGDDGFVPRDLDSYVVTDGNYYIDDSYQAVVDDDAGLGVTLEEPI